MDDTVESNEGARSHLQYQVTPEHQTSERHVRPEREVAVETARMLSAVGNIESKALLAVAMEASGRTQFTPYEVRREFATMQGARVTDAANIIFRGKETGPNYVRASFVKNGIVNVAAGDEEVFTMTQESETAAAFAAQLLAFSLRHPDISLNELFTYSKEADNASYIRFKILQELISMPKLPVRIVDIANGIGESPNIVRDHLRRMATNEILTYESSGTGSYALYRASGDIKADEVPPYGEEVQLTRNIAELFQKNQGRYMGVDDIIFHLGNDYAAYNGQNLGSDTWRQRIMTVLGYLKHNNQVPIESGEYAQDVRSRIDVPLERREMVEDVVNTVLAFQDRDERYNQEGLAVGRTIMSDPNGKVRALLQKAYYASAYTEGAYNGVSIPDRIMAELKTFQALNTSDLLGVLTSTGLSITRKTALHYLSKLEEAHAVAATSQYGNEKRWAVAA